MGIGKSRPYCARQKAPEGPPPSLTPEEKAVREGMQTNVAVWNGVILQALDEHCSKKDLEFYVRHQEVVATCYAKAQVAWPAINHHRDQPECETYWKRPLFDSSFHQSLEQPCWRIRDQQNWQYYTLREAETIRQALRAAKEVVNRGEEFCPFALSGREQEFFPTKTQVL
jgi:hypothetical protein